jgi:hypothetical protein
MTDGGLNDPTPQFGTAEYIGSPGGDHCCYCHQPISATYYRINDGMACPGCAKKAGGELAKDNQAYMRGLLYGIGAAIVGTIFCATAIKTRIVIGYFASLAVGWMVGKAILSGSNGLGGRRYQVTAALLTYAAVSMSVVPIAIYDIAQQWRARAQDQQFGDKRGRGTDSRQQALPTASRPAPGLENPVASRGEAIALLALAGLASPFVEAWDNLNIIKLLILFAGMGAAASITRGRKSLVIYGPFQNTAQPAS